jgi:predicted O-linked N-acetylglucosamine transferase (SPINDLY family)
MYERALACGHRATDVVKSLLYAATRSGELDKAYGHARRLLEDPALPADMLPAVIGVLGQACDFAARRVAWQRFLEQVERGAVGEPALGEALMYSTYESSLDEETVIRLHRTWARQVEAQATESRFREYPAACPGGRLRLAYLSPDFRGHSVGHFIRDVLAHHDRSAFEVICYSLTKREDQVTASIRGHVDRFLDITTLDDHELAQRIHADGVQLLVDLAGHSDGNRLRALARKPAPVQVTWIGYLHTTGLEAMDYRITDPHADDPAVPHGTEKLMVLPESFLCFGGFPETAIEPLPACHRHGHVTFASFNNLTKITAEAVRLWARILAAVPGSRMLVMATGAGSGAVADNLHAGFAAYGIGPERLELRHAVPRAEYFRLHNEVDVILDTFPFNGGTVTAGALWMGVPVVTRVGPAHRQRVSYSMLRTIGVEETIAWTDDDYVAAAVRLASDPEVLAVLRSRIAENTRRSILCDAPRFTRQLEAALRGAWDRYRAGGEDSGPEGR